MAWIFNNPVTLGAYNNNAKTDIMGIAYNSDLYYSDYNTLKSGYSDILHYAASLDGAHSKTAASNHLGYCWNKYSNINKL